MEKWYGGITGRRKTISSRLKKKERKKLLVGRSIFSSPSHRPIENFSHRIGTPHSRYFEHVARTRGFPANSLVTTPFTHFQADYYLCSSQTLPPLSATLAYQRAVMQTVTTGMGRDERKEERSRKKNPPDTADEYGISTRTSFFFRYRQVLTLEREASHLPLYRGKGESFFLRNKRK